MRALVLQAPGVVSVGEMAEPKMGEGDVLLAVDACTICGGDLKKVFAEHQSRQVGYPRFIQGHEYVGRVLDVGRNVTAFRPGDRVAHVHNAYCGTCFACRSGHANFCAAQSGERGKDRGAGFAERLVFSVRNGNYKVPDDIDTLHAAISEPATCAIGAVLRAEVRAGDTALVIGLGGLGLLVAQVLAGVGVRVLGVDVRRERVELGGAYCEAVVDASRDDLAAAVASFTRGIGVDRAFEAVGRAEPLRQAFDAVRLGGWVVLVGVHSQPMPRFDPEWIFRKDLRVVGAKGPSPLVNTQGEPLAFDLIRRGIIQPERMLVPYRLEEAQAAFDAQRGGRVLKAALCPGGIEHHEEERTHDA